MTTDRRTFLKRSASLGLVVAAGEVLKAQEEKPTEASRCTLANEKLPLQFDGRCQGLYQTWGRLHDG